MSIEMYKFEMTLNLPSVDWHTCRTEHKKYFGKLQQIIFLKFEDGVQVK